MSTSLRNLLIMTQPTLSGFRSLGCLGLSFSKIHQIALVHDNKQFDSNCVFERRKTSCEANFLCRRVFAEESLHLVSSFFWNQFLVQGVIFCLVISSNSFGYQGSMNALFLNHDGYLGALGTFVAPSELK